MHLRLLITYVSILTFYPSIAAQDLTGNFHPPQQAPEIRAFKAEGDIRVDGKLTERDWQKAEPIKDFFRTEPRQGGDYSFPTEIRILYDKKNIYIGAFCYDSLGKKGIRVQDLRRDFVWGENDIIGVHFDSQNLKQYCLGFQTTPGGNQRDLQVFNGDNFDADWNTLWTVRTHPTDSGYYAEFAIPFKSLRYDKQNIADSTSWGVTFIRFARRQGERTVFPPIPQAFTPYRMTYAADLKGLELPPPSTNIRIEPYILTQYDEINDENGTSTNANFKLGGEFKWAVNPKTVVDLTLNTDFAQADVDRAVNNLERFNIFFPERRQFFLENSGIWAGGLQTSIRPFFSRRIGLQGDFNAEPAPIDVGLRFTQRDEKGAIAGLYVRQRETANSQAANFGILRYQKNFGRENNIGMMVTHRQDEAASSLELREANNSTITLDGLIRPNSSLTINYLASSSIDYETSTYGYAGRVFIGNEANSSYLGWVTEYIDQNYNPEMGFIRQQNVIRHNPGGYYIWRPKKWNWLRRWDPGIFVDYYHDADEPSNFQQASLYIFPVYLLFTNGSFFEYSFFPTWQNINFEFAPLGVQVEQDHYYYTRHQIRFNTDRSKKYSLSGGINLGNFYNGKRNTYTSGLRIAPDPHIAFTADYEYNQIRSLGMEEDDLDIHLISVGGRLALNPRLQLSTFYQYNSFDEQARWNIRASWEYLPLSFVYLVYNNTQIDSFETPFKEQQFIGKVTLIRQF